jgi:hypothetical protein
MLKDSGLRLCYSSLEPIEFVDLSGFSATRVSEDLQGLRMKVFPEGGNFVTSVDGLYGLFESDGNDQTNYDRRNVYEKVFPGMDRLVGSVNIEHRG